jgi:hypothetical protein
VRDINELLASDEEKFLPVDVNIEILEMGIEKKCSGPEGAKLVEAIASVFEKASLVGCEKISGSMKDRMVIKATTGLGRSLDNKARSAPYLVFFDVRKSTKSPKAMISVLFDSLQYSLLKSRIESVVPIANLSIDDASISITINNDEKEMVIFYPNTGTFVNGEPVDYEGEVKLEPRNQFNLKLGDVKMAFLSKSKWADAMALNLQTTSK